MMKLQVEIHRCDGYGKLISTVADVDIVNTLVEATDGIEYDVRAVYSMESGPAIARGFIVVHDRLEGMWPLIQKVAAKLKQMEDEDRQGTVTDYLNSLRLDDEVDDG